jgi:hypothetical protein
MAIETLMDVLAILPNTTTTLHKKIEAFRQIKPEVGDHLLAIKWIGNSGSHAAILTKKDLLDAYELMEFSLQQLYRDRERRLNRLSQEINLQKGPRS